MSRFYTRLIIELMQDENDDVLFSRGGRQLFKLHQPLIYQSDLFSETELLEVPVGFVTDLASVPHIPIAYLALNGQGDAAAVIHDYLYSKKPVDRKKADEILLEALEVCGIGFLTRWSIYLGVRIGGIFAWNKK